ncbi:uncharacterized protein FOMMEDRAFT_138253 [Fomitiporia mediterranea MF3/22]|uniref:uncharacterized protein n=1 Tax=Fomitiporia mediterranea (strain MF3/22) TaxID=694068 RepID=UPI0004408C8A|nr:uncharacterized protein FOMMEDRAFT_138253 [Fomitiporia mediterranea MF3/22]EJD08466.1 hypothetical protein FOMMEDRAFT_138253 [Fomitiporia mediterranea MF3/22]
MGSRSVATCQAKRGDTEQPASYVTRGPNSQGGHSYNTFRGFRISQGLIKVFLDLNGKNSSPTISLR